MVAVNPIADPENVVQSLVYTLGDVFDATRDLHGTLKSKDKRDHEELLRSRGYSDSRRVEYVDDEPYGDQSIGLDKAAVTREFETGLQQIGTQFAIGDVITQTGLQSQIIALQSVLVTTFLYGPTSPEPISHHISNLVAASRVAGTAAVEILSAQLQRQLSILPPTPRSSQSPTARSSIMPPPLYPVTVPPTTMGSSTALVRSYQDSPWPSGSRVATNPTIASLASRPKVTRSDTESTSFSGPTAYGSQTSPHAMFCLYAADLQRHPTQPLSSSINSSSPHCSHCKRDLHLSPGKSWEIFKDNGIERCFRIQNRFVVKCHRDSPDGGYTCVLCSRSGSVDTVCGDVRALVRHVWMDHDVRELEAEEDILEVVEKETELRRDSGLGFTDHPRSRRSTRSMSLGPGTRRIKREVDILEVRAPAGRLA